MRTIYFKNAIESILNTVSLFNDGELKEKEYVRAIRIHALAICLDAEQAIAQGEISLELEKGEDYDDDTPPEEKITEKESEVK